MKLIYHLLAVAVMAGSAAAVVMPPPNGVECWSSTLDIISAEVMVIYNPPLKNTERIYDMCSTTIPIGIVTFDNPIPVGGDFPLFLFNPNVHIRCADPGTCSFSGGERQVVTLKDTQLLVLFLSLQGGPALPNGYVVDSSNLIVDGMVFTESSRECGMCEFSQVEMTGPGQNIQFHNCLWKDGNLDNPVYSAIKIAYDTRVSIMEGKAYNIDVRLKNCEIKDSAYRYALIWTTWTGEFTEAPETQGTQLILDGTKITNNTVTSTADDGSTLSRSSLITLFFADIFVFGSVISGNVLTSGFAPINLFNSRILLLTGSPLSDNIMIEQTGACADVQIVTVTGSQPGERFYDLEGCFVIEGLTAASCFSGASTVQIEGVGPTQLKDVAIGQKVLVGDNKYEPLYSFGHSEEGARVNLRQIKTANGSQLQISDDHMVFVEHGGAIPSALIKVGDKVMTANSVELTIVESIDIVESRGIFAPFTPSGTIVVDGMLVSSFVGMNGEPGLSIGGFKFSHQWMAHSFEFPHRVVCHYIGSCQNETYTKNGISTWVATPMKLGQWLLNQNFAVTALVGGTFVGMLALFNVAELLIRHPLSCVVTVYLCWKMSIEGLKDKQKK